MQNRELVGSCYIAQAAQLGALCSSVLCEDLEGWDWGRVGGRSKREGLYVYIQLIHLVIKQKLMQHYRVIILQFKKIRKF